MQQTEHLIDPPIDLMRRAGLLDTGDVSPYVDRDPDLSADDLIELLSRAGVLTERQAEAFVYRRSVEMNREETASRMEISASTVDDYLRAAEEKIAAAWATEEVVERFVRED